MKIKLILEKIDVFLWEDHFDVTFNVLKVVSAFIGLVTGVGLFVEPEVAAMVVSFFTPE